MKTAEPLFPPDCSRAWCRVARVWRACRRTSLDAIPPKLARDHYEALQERASETTAQIHVRALRAFFNAHKTIARINPFADLELAKIDQPARVIYCTKPQREALIKAATTDDLLFILLAGFDAGLRKNEIIEARVFFFDMAGHAPTCKTRLLCG